ncbi:hypothetical protein BKK51_13050 [Rodentibacter trehalosifermentans]|uniref:Uncharacterized protein n=1 Tax=Rodentibacter trehalosifermentans TaxID=1908263 RepID=A0A1V3IKM5_9PAST|nr:hypothetical protein [Rodentibacter trehalosifermentans]OOF42178.1 hypothetical protein BKK51_13050 [Rodentibacter trehalosifermentans]
MSATNTDGSTNKVKAAEGWTSLDSSLGVGIGRDKENHRSLTRSGINTANIEIRDEKAQFEKTGKTIEETKAAITTKITTEMAEKHSGKLTNHFDKEKVMKELNIQVEVTKDFRKNAFSAIDSYVLPKQADLRKQIKEAKTEEEKTALYNEIYKLQYQKRLLETVVGIVAGSPDVAITQGTLQLAATKMREETLKNSRLFKGIKDAKTGKIYRNDSYDSGYFDGVKLGGVRLNINAICNSNVGNCSRNSDGTMTFEGGDKYPTLDKVFDPKNDFASGFYGATGGHQPEKGGWYLPGLTIRYEPGDLSDILVESFAGTHDLIGGQRWGFYDYLGNTSEKTKGEKVAAEVITWIAIPVAAPFALADFFSSDMVEILMKGLT